MAYTAPTMPAPKNTTPTPDASYLDVTHAPYNANANFGADAAPAIQQAIQDAQTQGKNVYIPAGNFKLKSSFSAGGNNYCLQATGSNTRGDGTPVTVLGAGRKHTCLVWAGSDWGDGAGITFTSTKVTDSAKSWTVNEWAGAKVYLPGGTHNTGYMSGTVASNTATALTLAAAWSPAGGQPNPPQAGTAYVVTHTDPPVVMLNSQTDRCVFRDLTVDTRTFGGNTGFAGGIRAITTNAQYQRWLSLGIWGGSDYSLRNLGRSDSSHAVGNSADDIYLAGYGLGIVADWDIDAQNTHSATRIVHVGGRIAYFTVVDAFMAHLTFTPDPLANFADNINVSGNNGVDGMTLRDIATYGKGIVLPAAGPSAPIKRNITIQRLVQHTAGSGSALNCSIGDVLSLKILNSKLNVVLIDPDAYGVTGSVDSQTTYLAAHNQSTNAAPVSVSGLTFT